MKKLSVLVLLVSTTLSLGATVSYLDQQDYCDFQDSDFLKVHQLMEKGEDHKAFYLLQKIVKKSCRASTKAKACITEGWLAYRYRLYDQAIDSWEQALGLLGEPHPWVNLWLSCCYLSKGNVLRAQEIFVQVPKPAKDAGLYLTLQSRLSAFRVPLKEAKVSYLDFVSFLGANSQNIFIGNLYGGLCSFNVNNSEVTVLEPAVPSMVGNPLGALLETEEGLYLAKKSGLYYMPKKGKTRPIAMPDIKEATQQLKAWIAWDKNLVGLWVKDGLWLYLPSLDIWKNISGDVKEGTFLIKVGEGKQEQLLFLNGRAQLTSLTRDSSLEGYHLQVYPSVTLGGEWFEPVKGNSQEFYLASSKGDLLVLSWDKGEWRRHDLLQSDDKTNWLAFWKGEKSPYLSVVNTENQWQRLDQSGKVVETIRFPFPILNGLINHSCVGAGYVWVNVASEVYALSEELLFTKK